MNYTTDMSSAFKSIQNYICIWRGTFFDELFSAFSELARDAELWAPSPAPADLIRQFGDGIYAGVHGYTLDTDDDEESKPRNIWFSWRQSHVSLANTLLRE